MTIEFTHFTPPAMRGVIRHISRSQATETRAIAVVKAGGKFTVTEIVDYSGREAIIACSHNGDTLTSKKVPVAVFPIADAIDFVVEKAYKILVIGS